MTRSFKMVVLLAMLAEGAFPGAIPMATLQARVRDLARRYATADELMYDLEYYIYHEGYGPTNETLGKFMRELFGQSVPAASAIEDSHGKTVLLEQTARLKERAPKK